ncbi:hypothetical protein DFH07DRAFT_864942 [Mycena maculata]|uniref:Uncharacterized protein n=1 Tax=Mycena maculata TaxID=230809 RepID=A0AAD7P024_9AGAR|nr:hypothetical protein DFH07DRAFT_864942 [Mycena maculata]
MQYKDLSTAEEKEYFFAQHGVRWTEFAQLDYFDIVRYTVVDPMHNLLLGLAKTQCLPQFESLLWAGRLPLRVGEPAGGSLTADEYKFAVTGPWAVVIPIVWERFQKESEEDYKKAMERYPTAKRKYKSKLKQWEKGNKRSDPPSMPKKPIRREDTNFLRFATALKILLYGMAEMKPNHHWCVHIPDQVRDYGPLYSFWAFLMERLNKVLKNLNSNNWAGGLLEVSMVREFH